MATALVFLEINDVDTSPLPGQAAYDAIIKVANHASFGAQQRLPPQLAEEVEQHGHSE